MDFLIYTGIAVNVTGAVLLGIYAIKYYGAFKDSKRLPIKMNELKSQWAAKRRLGFGLIIGGNLIAMLGCLL